MTTEEKRQTVEIVHNVLCYYLYTGAVLINLGLFCGAIKHREFGFALFVFLLLIITGFGVYQMARELSKENS